MLILHRRAMELLPMDGNTKEQFDYKGYLLIPGTVVQNRVLVAAWRAYSTPGTAPTIHLSVDDAKKYVDEQVCAAQQKQAEIERTKAAREVAYARNRAALRGSAGRGFNEDLKSEIPFA